MIGRAELERAKDSAILVNVARGPVVDEAALYEALKTRRIRGAFIDVWYTYPGQDNPAPLPSQFPFHELDNVIMTPHCAGRTREGDIRRWKTVGENLRRWRQGEPLMNVVMDNR
jgi:phosphoglycerate dehydrogenase-like enzyme